MPDPKENQGVKSIQGVELFEVGVWKGDKYTLEDIDHLVDSFGKTGISPPLKLGHTKDQKLLQKDGLPAAGYVDKLYRNGKKLLADFRDIPSKIYNLITKKAYDRVSSEIYWDYSDANSKAKYPRVLKAVALLGADIPELTSLDAISELYDSEGRAYKTVFFDKEKEFKEGATHSEAWYRCVEKVKASGSDVNAYAVCTASLQKTGNLWASKDNESHDFNLGQEVTMTLDELASSDMMVHFNMGFIEALRKKGVKAIKMMPDYSIEEMMGETPHEEEKMSKEIETALDEQKKKNEELADKVAEFSKREKESADKLVEMAKQNETLGAQVKAIQEEAKAEKEKRIGLEAQQRKDRISGKVSEYIKAKRITPAQGPLLQTWLENMPESEFVVVYSKDGKPEEQKFKGEALIEKFMSLQAPFINTDEKLQQGVDADETDEAREVRIKAYCKDNSLNYSKSEDYKTALKAVTKGRAA